MKKAWPRISPINNTKEFWKKYPIELSQLGKIKTNPITLYNKIQCAGANKKYSLKIEHRIQFIDQQKNYQECYKIPFSIIYYLFPTPTLNLRFYDQSFYIRSIL